MKKIYLIVIIIGVFLCVVSASILDNRFDSRSELFIRSSAGAEIYNMSEVGQRFDNLKYLINSFSCEESTNHLCLQDPISGENNTVVNDSGYFYSNGYAVDSTDTLGDGEFFCSQFDGGSCPVGANIFIVCDTDGSFCYFNGVNCQYDFSGNAVNTSNKAIIGYDGGRTDSDIERWIDFEGNNCEMGVYDIF